MENVELLTSKLSVLVDESVYDMMENSKALTSRFEKDFSSIKDVCSNFFESYDNTLQKIKLE